MHYSKRRGNNGFAITTAVRTEDLEFLCLFLALWTQRHHRNRAKKPLCDGSYKTVEFRPQVWQVTESMEVWLC